MDFKEERDQNCSIWTTLAKTEHAYSLIIILGRSTVWERHGVVYFRSRFLYFKQPIKKIPINSKIPCPQSPSFLVPRLCRLREKEKRKRLWRRECSRPFYKVPGSRFRPDPHKLLSIKVSNVKWPTTFSSFAKHMSTSYAMLP